jgi:predicted HicB family RNase H-like nuclease
MLHYKGYSGSLDVDTDAGCLFGRVLDIRDVVTFKGETVEQAIQAFHDSVDDYLDFCASLAQEPNKPFSGKLPFRTTPEHHHKIFLAATKQKMSINAWMDEVLLHAAEEAIKSR